MDLSGWMVGWSVGSMEGYDHLKCITNGITCRLVEVLAQKLVAAAAKSAWEPLARLLS